MAIYDPSLRLTKGEQEAISILDSLLAQAGRGEGSDNSGTDLVEIAPAEARILAEFMSDFRVSRKFRECAYFTEAMAQRGALTNDRAKEIFLSWRSRFGKTRVASTFTWNEFVLRSGFGFSDKTQMYVRAYRSPVTPMHMKHFLAMEVRLSRSYGLSKDATEIVTEYYRRRLRLIDDVRKGDRQLPLGAVDKSAAETAQAFDALAKCSPSKSVSKGRLAACTGLIMDVGAMFITRDWTATGVASVLGSSIPDLIGVE